MKDYDEIFEQLHDEGLIVSRVTQNNVEVGLEVYSSALQGDVRMEIVKMICGEYCRVHFLPNFERIIILINPSNH